ncbi:hypothetical protein BD770DRAFT_384363 [Pilaira anomala]|nr:hypothetical protein BD770DRAFT_384363 [Pilaira anomala]
MSVSTQMEMLDVFYQKLESFSLKDNGSDIIKPVCEKANSLLDEEREVVQKLEKEVLKENEKEAELLRMMNEAKTVLDMHQQKVKEYQALLEQENELHKNLLKKIEVIKEDIRIETDNETAADDLSGESVKLAIFREMGILMKVDDDYQVKRSFLNTDDGHEVRSIPLENYNINTTSKFIWDFISKNM